MIKTILPCSDSRKQSPEIKIKIDFEYTEIVKYGVEKQLKQILCV